MAQKSNVKMRNPIKHFNLIRLISYSKHHVLHNILPGRSDFYRAAWNAVYMQTRSSHENSVCPSVCLSVRLSVKRVNCDKTEEKSVQKDHLA